MRRMLIVATAIWATLLIENGSAQDDQPLNHQIVAKRLLKDYWEKESGNRDAASVFWANHKSAANSNSDALLAYVYNRMRHARIREALKAATELNELDPRHVDGWLVRIWLETTTDNFNRALVKMGLLKQELDLQTNLRPDIRSSILRKLGRLVGFMEGPVNRRVNIDTLEQAIATIASKLAPPELQTFNDERKKVIDRFTQVSATNSQTINNEKDRLQRVINVETQNLEQAKRDYDQRISQLAPQIDQLRLQADQQISVARQQAEPLEREAVSIDTAIANAQSDLNLLYWDLARFDNVAPRRNPNNVFIWRAIRNRQLDLNNLYARADAIAIQLADAVARVRQIEFEYGQRIDALNNEINQLGRAKNRSQKRLNKLAKGPVVASGKLQAMDNRVKSILTYDQFPLEMKRQELLNRLK